MAVDTNLMCRKLNPIIVPKVMEMLKVCRSLKKRLNEPTQLLHLLLLESCNSILDTLTSEPRGIFNKLSKHSNLADPAVLQSLMLLASLMKDIQQMIPNTPLLTRRYSADHIDLTNFSEFQLTVGEKYSQPSFEQGSLKVW